MEELVVQPDGFYNLCFRNFKNISNEQMEATFSEFGHVHSLRKSNGTVPWVFVRYKHKEEAQKALNKLKGSKEYDVRPAKSSPKRLQEQEGEHRGKSDSCASENTRENRTMKGYQSRNKQLDKLSLNSADNAGEDNNGGCSKRSQMCSSKQQRPIEFKLSEGRAAEEFHRKNDSISPRLVSQPPGNHATGAIPRQKLSGDNGPPRLVKGSEYYASETHGSESRILATKAAYEEVWSNHPLRSKMQLWEVILTNFLEPPSRKDIYEFCEGINLLHVSMGRTFEKELSFCRVLVATEDDVNNLYELNGTEFNGSEVLVTCLEDLLDGQCYGYEDEN